MSGRLRSASTRRKGISLQELRGGKVVLYFYPKDMTPGCTREACDFRDHWARIRHVGAEVFGVSGDSLRSHARFRETYDLPFDLLSDPDNETARAYGAYGKKSMYGKTVLGTIRSTFLIDGSGRIVESWSPVRVNGHVENVLAALRGTGSGPRAAAAPGAARPGTSSRNKKAAKAPSVADVGAQPETRGLPDRGSKKRKRIGPPPKNTSTPAACDSSPISSSSESPPLSSTRIARRTSRAS